jgi:hypothetical protein
VRCNAVFLAFCMTLGCDSDDAGDGVTGAAAKAATDATAAPEASGPDKPAPAADAAAAVDPPGASTAGGETGSGTGTETGSVETGTDETGHAADAGDLLTRVGALPPIDFAEHDGVSTAQEKNRAALSAHGTKDFTTSIEGFMDAVQTDPGHVLARYNLSCALAMESQDAAAFAVLEQLEQAGCASCFARVMAAKRDADWRKYQGDPRLAEITGRVKEKLDKPKVAAKKVLKWLDSGKDKHLPPTFDPRRKVKLKISRWGNEEFVDTKAKKAGAAKVRKWIDKQAKDAMNGFSIGDHEVTQCKDDCCRFESEGGILPHTMYPNTVCFRVEEGRAVVITALEFNEG